MAVGINGELRPSGTFLWKGVVCWVKVVRIPCLLVGSLDRANC
tara:strand:- start:403 stop:531 length:129 start_codon:yes stop_codon:yes gene_type:complete